MDYTKLKSEFRELVEITAEVPEAFREKCFEMLLNNLLAGEDGAPMPVAGNQLHLLPSPASSQLAADSTPGENPLTAQLRVFMQRTNVTMEDLQAVLFVDGTNVHFVREPAHGTVAKGQIEWAPLLALKNGILNNELSTDPEDVRSICQAKGFYDRTNFAAIFKRQPYAGYFRQPLQPQGPRQSLVTEGQAALSEHIRA